MVKIDHPQKLNPAEISCYTVIHKGENDLTSILPCMPTLAWSMVSCRDSRFDRERFNHPQRKG